MTIEITATGSTIKFLRKAGSAVLKETRFNAATTSITLKDNTFRMFVGSRYTEEFEFADVTIPLDVDADALLNTLNALIPAGSAVTNIGNIQYISTETDFPIVGGEIRPENDINYVLTSANFSLTMSINLTDVTTTGTIDFNNNTLIYSGASELYTGAMTGGMVIENAIIINVSSAKIFDITGSGSPVNAFINTDIIYVGFASVGSISGFGIAQLLTIQFGDCGIGLQFSDIGLLLLTNNPFSNTVSSNSPRIVLNGTINTFLANNSNTSISSGESMFHISKDIAMTKSDVDSYPYTQIAGSNFLAPDITGAITAFATNGAGGTTVTSAAHGLTIEMVAEITASGVGAYDAIHDIFNITINTFDIPIGFISDPMTGNFDIGDSNGFLDLNEFEFRNNGDQKDSNSICKYISLNLILITIGAANTPVNVLGNPGDWSGIVERRFELQAGGDPNGSARFTWTSGIEFRVSARVSLAVVSGGAKELTAYITLNGVVQTDSKFSFDSSREMTLNPEDILTLTPSDFIGVAVENNDDTTNINVNFVNMNIVKA